MARGHACRAQLSLEYLLLLAAFFSVLLLMLPLIQRAYALALFGFDARQAESFSRDFAQKARQLSILSENSVLSIEIQPLQEWQISASGKKLVVSFGSKQLGKTKTIETELFADFALFEKTASGKTVLVLEKKGGLLVVNSNA